MKKLYIFASVILSATLLMQLANAGGTSKMKFNYKEGVESVSLHKNIDIANPNLLEEIKKISDADSYIKNSVAFVNTGNNITDIDVEYDDKSFTLVIKTDNLETKPDKLTMAENPLMMAFMNRYNEGAYGYIFPYAAGNINGLAPERAVYFFDTPLYINNSRVKGEFSILISARKKGSLYRTWGIPTAFFNNNPYGRYLETEDGNCYTLGSNTSHDINIYKKSCSKVKS